MHDEVVELKNKAVGESHGKERSLTIAWEIIVKQQEEIKELKAELKKRAPSASEAEPSGSKAKKPKKTN